MEFMRDFTVWKRTDRNVRNKHYSLVIMDKIPSVSFYKPYKTEKKNNKNMALQRERKGENIKLSKKITIVIVWPCVR